MDNLVSLVIPCYNEEASLPKFWEETLLIVNQMQNVDFEFIFVNDGSRDRTLQIIQQFAAADQRVKYISFSRNFGKEAAMYAGLLNAEGEYAATMDADLQDPPSLLPVLYHAVAEEGYDSAATRRVSRKGEPRIRSFFARAFYRIINKISDIDIADGARDFRLMNRKFLNALLSLKERNRFSKGLFGWVGYKTKWIEFENVERVAGETKWSFWKLFKYSLEGVAAFSTVPLLVSSIVGFIICFITLIATAFIFFRRLLYGDPVSGWASTACIITFLGGIQMFFQGIIGYYLSKTYLEVKGRPLYLIAESNKEKVK